VQPYFVEDDSSISELLAARGIRLTRQREKILAILLQQKDHPTASDVYERAKQKMPSISLATVYNCLEALARSGLLKQVNVDRAPTRFCANLQDHGHFFCERCGGTYDVEAVLARPENLPPGFIVFHADVTLKGLCSNCSDLNV
jgi:Fe2+ or Zn2+ uptake regulation protein